MNEHATATAVRKPKVMTVSGEPPKYVPLLRDGDAVEMKSGLVTLAPGESVGEHSTGQHEEQLVIMDGTGSVEAEGLPKQAVTRGNFVYIPPQTKHNVFAANDHSLQYVYIVSKVAPESA